MKNLEQATGHYYKEGYPRLELYPDWSESIKKASPRIEEVTYDASRRFTKDGKYIGVTAGYNYHAVTDAMSYAIKDSVDLSKEYLSFDKIISFKVIPVA